MQLLDTRCCPACGDRIIEGGRVRSRIVYDRYQAMHSRFFLKYWLWIWPALGALAITWQWLDASALQQCPNWVWVAPLIGTVAAGWSWIRTFDRRYVPPLVASIVLLVVSVTIR